MSPHRTTPCTVHRAPDRWLHWHFTPLACTQRAHGYRRRTEADSALSTPNNPTKIPPTPPSKEQSARSPHTHTQAHQQPASPQSQSTLGVLCDVDVEPRMEDVGAACRRGARQGSVLRRGGFLLRCVLTEGAPSTAHPVRSTAARQHGSTAARQHGSTAARQHGSTAARQHGSTAARQHGIAPSSHHHCLQGWTGSGPLCRSCITLVRA
jgi:hypothetical protein